MHKRLLYCPKPLKCSRLYLNCFLRFADLAKKFSIPFTPGVISVPGLGFVQLQALSDEPSQVQIPHMGHMMLEQELSDDLLISNEEVASNFHIPHSLPKK